jgi:S1-C subfamily serine protease
MNVRLTTLIFCLAFGVQAAIAQDAANVSRQMELGGSAPSPQQMSAGAELPGGGLEDFSSGLPTNLLSRIAQTAVSEPAGTSRSAKDAQIYRNISPSVVLIVSKDGLGSGSLLGSTGTVLTNYHVVKGNSTVAVVFKPAAEGTRPTRDDMKVGQVVKYDEIADLALVRVSDVPLGRAPIRLGSNDEISVGADVHAIGHPTGEAWTYTTGVISQYRMGYIWSAEDKIKHKADIIQTQTPINPGNSGGPLVSDSGTLIGVNSFKAQGEGLSFAVSVDNVKQFLSRSDNRTAETAVVAKKAGCVAQAFAKFRNKANNATVTPYDLLCTGKTNSEYIVPDMPTDPILLRVDRNGDGNGDVVFFDLKRRGKWDVSWWDEDYSGHWSLVGYHDDGTLKPTRFESYAVYEKRMASNQ